MSNVVFQLSPYPAIKKIRIEKDTKDFDAAPLVSIAFGCVQWSFYGMFAKIVTGKAGFLIVVYANCFGTFVGGFYVLSYHMYCRCPQARSKLYQYYQMVGNLILIQGCVIFTLPLERALLFCGCIASISTIVSALSPWSTVSAVISTQNSESMPVPLLGASLISSGLWLICGLLLWDVWIMVPNLIGTVSNILLVGIALKYQMHEIEKSVSTEQPCKACHADCESGGLAKAPLDEQLPLWSWERSSWGSSGGTF